MTLRDVENSWLERETGILRTLRAAAEGLEEHVCPIFSATSDNELAPVGTGVLARLDDRRYLLSAAHVFDLCDGGVFIPRQSGLIEPLQGSIIVSARPQGGSRDDDAIDIGFVRLIESEWQGMGEHRFVDLEASGSDEPLDLATSLFVVLGFPLRDHTNIQGTDRVSGELTRLYLGGADEGAQLRARIDARGQFLLRFDRRLLATRKSVGAPPDMTGMSGGGVWPVRLAQSEPSLQVPFFAGIVVERPRRFKAALACTRATLMKYFVRKFDDAA